MKPKPIWFYLQKLLFQRSLYQKNIIFPKIFIPKVVGHPNLGCFRWSFCVVGRGRNVQIERISDRKRMSGNKCHSSVLLWTWREKVWPVWYFNFKVAVAGIDVCTIHIQNPNFYGALRRQNKPNHILCTQPPRQSDHILQHHLLVSGFTFSSTTVNSKNLLMLITGHDVTSVMSF